MSAYISVKLTNLPSSAGIVGVILYDARSINNKHENEEKYYSFCKLISFRISGGMGPEKSFPSMLV